MLIECTQVYRLVSCRPNNACTQKIIMSIECAQVYRLVSCRPKTHVRDLSNKKVNQPHNACVRTQYNDSKWLIDPRAILNKSICRSTQDID